MIVLGGRFLPPWSRAWGGGWFWMKLIPTLDRQNVQRLVPKLRLLTFLFSNQTEFESAVKLV